ncbi:helicase-associated domain-containing protein [Microbacter sp. GSS18]|nr:helicase-associated domain-containing protein [Microbacter sp. GSS18]
MPSDERALATWLAAREDDALAEILAARGVSPTAAWQDFFDAADGLLDAASLDRALTAQDRQTLIAVAADEPPGDVTTRDRLTGLALLGEDGRPLGAVRERADALRASAPEAFAAQAPPPPPTASEPRQAAAAAERLFTTSGALADVLLTAHATPLTRTGAGAVSAVDRKRLIESGAVDTVDELDDLVLLAESAGLAVAVDREWTVTDAARTWLEAPTPQRWQRVAEGFRDSLPAGLRTSDGGWIAVELWSGAYPLNPDWPVRAERLMRAAARWGLIAADGSEPAWTTPLREGRVADPAPLAAMLPAEIDRVYLQADLSAIAPGPLAPALDLRLRTLARRESRAQASTYRFTADSLTAALTEGETAESIRAFLGELSLTGIPQPLEYLIESTSSRHGLVQVSADAASGRTRVDSDDLGVLDALSVDQALRPLGLVPDGAGLATRVGRDAVYWSLADARYPVVAVDADGRAEAMHRRTASGTAVSSAEPAETYAALVANLRQGHGDSGEDAWLQRELEQWVRARAEIIVTVRMPDGSERTLRMEATGLGGGRLRGRDRAADIERTLPVTSIVSVRPV